MDAQEKAWTLKLFYFILWRCHLNLGAQTHEANTHHREAHCGICLEVRAPLAIVSFLLPPCRARGSNSGHYTWYPSHWAISPAPQTYLFTDLHLGRLLCLLWLTSCFIPLYSGQVSWSPSQVMFPCLCWWFLMLRILTSRSQSPVNSPVVDFYLWLFWW